MSVSHLIGWLNFSILIVSTFLITILYIKSVRPAALERKIGEIAYKKCSTFRFISGVFIFVSIINYTIYFFFPLNLDFPRYFAWSYWISLSISISILVPSLLLMIIGLKDAGEEAMKPSKDHKMYEGIYRKIRHPQALGEVWIWLAVAFLLNSPLLSIFSIVYFPIFYLFCYYEEKDLVLRFGKAYIDYKNQTGMFIPKRKT